MNKDIVNEIFPEAVKQVELGKCPSCKTKVNEGSFRDELSKTEFTISGLCQECQDKIFGTE